MLATVGLTALAGCGGSDGAQPGSSPTLSPPPLGSTAAPTSWWAAQSALPLMAYDLSDQDASTVRKASTVLIVQCMQQKGFTDFTAASLGTPPAQNVRKGGGGPWGFIDQDVASSRGFHPPATGGRSPATSGGKLPDAERQQSIACISDSTRKLGQTVNPTGESLVNRLMDQALNATAADRRTRDASLAWATCMKGRGFDAVDPAALADPPRWATPQPTSTEIATALADVACTASTNLAGIYFAVETAYQKVLVESNLEALKAVSTSNQARVAAAAGVIARQTQ